MKDTGWGKVSGWYDEVVENDDSYQKKVILPNLLRVLEIKRDEKVLDLACGQGFFARELAKLGANVTGVDIGRELIDLAKKKSVVENLPIEYFASPSDQLKMIKNETLDKVVVVLAIQNIEKMDQTLAEVSRILKNNGSLFLVLNHPVLRIPGATSWGYDEEKKVQYRRLDSYMSESSREIDMSPGKNSAKKSKKDITYSFHRPLQVYFKSLRKNSFAVTRLEEWLSHKESEVGPRKSAEDRSRHEFPMFLLLEAKNSATMEK